MKTPIGKLFNALAVVMMAGSVFAAVTVSDVRVQQRWPWNGKVDIDYTVASDSPEDEIFVYPLGVENDRNVAIAPRTLEGEGVVQGTCGARVRPGTHRLTWRMDLDEPTLHSSSFTMTMHAVKSGMYLVVDLSAGPNAESYPITHTNTPPNLEDDACRTSQLWLRLCLPGTFMMGSPSDEPNRGSNEQLHRVTLTKPFYIGVLEVTQAQYVNVMGVNPSEDTVSRRSGKLGNLFPVVQVSYGMLRGSVTGNAYPQHSQVDADSFFGKIRARTGCLFDLPTEAQWEYACRAGSGAPLYSGKEYSDANMYELGRVSGNQSDGKGGESNGYTKGGMYAPNAWGLYDMLGNVEEVCLDWYGDNYGIDPVSDPVGPATGSYRIGRGGSFFNGNKPRSAYRFTGFRWDNGWNDITSRYSDTGRMHFGGFRVVCIPVVQ